MLFPTKNAINHKKIVLITFCQQTNNLNVFCNICVGTHFPHGGKTYIPMSVLVHFINLQPFHPQPLVFEANWAPDVLVLMFPPDNFVHFLEYTYVGVKTRGPLCQG